MTQSLGFARRWSSASTASRMNCARLFGPAMASMRLITSADSRTCVGFTPSAGLPMRGRVSDTETNDKPIPPIDVITDTVFISDIGYGDKSMSESVSIFERAKGPYCLEYKGDEIQLQGRHGKIVRRYPGSAAAMARAELKRLQARHVKSEALITAATPDMISLVGRVASLNPNAGEIGAGMLAQLVAEARRIQGQIQQEPTQ